MGCIWVPRWRAASGMISLTGTFSAWFHSPWSTGVLSVLICGEWLGKFGHSSVTTSCLLGNLASIWLREGLYAAFTALLLCWLCCCPAEAGAQPVIHGYCWPTSRACYWGRDIIRGIHDTPTLSAVPKTKALLVQLYNSEMIQRFLLHPCQKCLSNKAQHVKEMTDSQSNTSVWNMKCKIWCRYDGWAASRVLPSDNTVGMLAPLLVVVRWVFMLILLDHSWRQCLLSVAVRLCLTYSSFDSSLHVAPQKQEVELTGTTAAWVDCGTLTLLFAPEVFSALKQRRRYNENMWTRGAGDWTPTSA